MSPLVVAAIVAAILAAIDVVRSRGQSLTAWAVVVLCAGILWGHLP